MLQFLTNNKGEKVAVQIPIAEWDALNQKLKHLEQFEQLKEGFKSAFREWEQIKQGKKEIVTLKDFLNAQ
ncbi:MAG: hypothetical protein EAZ06_08075 [Cytophagales bacterium]|nr:MAG: hypothetical protein EAZ06_08075 [Cytophagales bacterium]